MIKFYLFLIFAFSVFLLGITVGHDEIFPFELIQNFKFLLLGNFKTVQNDIIIYEDNIDSLILINSENDIIKKKEALINFIWNDQVQYSSIISIDQNIMDKRYQDLTNLKSIHKFDISMEYGINSIAYLFLPENSNDKLIIYHQGHDGDFIIGKENIDFFLNKNYAVLAFSMPLLGMNDQPIIDLERFGKIKFTSHNQLEFLESTDFSPIKFFVEPIGVSLNYLDENFNFNSYYMVGISGGGWTTVLFSAIDDRITQSYSVAGTVPMFMRSDSKNIGDYEQRVPEFYQIANYLELYILSSFGDERTHIQIFNKYDPCCFSGEMYTTYYDEIKNRMNQLGKGEFEIFLDDTHHEHKISQHALEIIKNSIEKNNVE